MEDVDIEVVFASESVQQRVKSSKPKELPQKPLICFAPESTPLVLNTRLVPQEENDDFNGFCRFLKVPCTQEEKEILEKTICLSDSEGEEEGTADVSGRSGKTATPSLSACSQTQTVPKMVGSLWDEEYNWAQLSPPIPEVFANTHDDAGRSPSYDYQHCSECHKASEAVTRMELKLEGFKMLTAKLQSRLVVLRDLVRYLPVPPSPTVIHEPELDPNDVTIDLITDNEDEEDEEPMPHCRRRFHQNTNEIEVEILKELTAPKVSGIEEASPPKKSRVSKIKRSRNKKRRAKVPRQEGTRGAVYKGGTCSKMFPSQVSLRGHIASMKHKGSFEISESQGNNEEPLFVCCVCKKKFKTKQKLNSHEKGHENTETFPFTCSSCPKRFQTRRGLEHHENRHKNEETSPFTCVICRKAFKTKRELEIHGERHENDITRPFICTVCSKGFKAKNDLTKHVKRHDNDITRPFICTVCSKRFNAKNDLTKHVKRHDNDITRPFICTVCSKRFKVKSDLTIHVKRHDNDITRPFVCTVCSKGFKTRTELAEHVERHENAETRPFVCTNCSYGFATKKDLRSHKYRTKCIKNKTVTPSI